MLKDEQVLKLIKEYTNRAKRWRTKANKLGVKLSNFEGTRRANENLYQEFRNALLIEKINWYTVLFISEHGDIPDYHQQVSIEHRAKYDMGMK